MSKYFLASLAMAASAMGFDDKTLESLTVTNVGAVRGNLYLPPNAPDGSTITWSSSNPAVVSADGIVDRQGQDTKVTLTATVGSGNNILVRDFDAKVLAKHTRGELAGYGFAFFTGNSIEGENIYFASSVGNNALKWRELNGGKPVIKSIYGTKGLRDPFLMRSYEGDTFYLIATDLSIGSGTSWGNSVRKGSRYLEIWESHDLISWSDQRHVLVSPETAGNTWAAEAFYDEQLGEYVVYWASSLYPVNDKNHTTSTYHRMMYATTRDFVTFSDAKVWQDAHASRIDTTVLQNGANFHRFTKDEGASETGCTDIIQERGTDFLGQIDKWTVIDTCIGKKAGSKAVEGPTVFKSNPGDVNGEKYYLFVDEFGGRGYIPLETADIENPNWTVSSSYQLPSNPRHGTVVALTTNELLNLNKLMPPIAKANNDGQILKYDFSTGINNAKIADQSGNGFDGTINGGSIVRDDYMIFDGVDDYVTIPDNILSGVDDVSVEVEVYINQKQATPFFIYGLGNTARGIGSGYLYATGSPFKAGVSSGNWANEEAAGSNSNLARGEWLHIVYTLTNNTAIVYIAGVEVGRLENAKLMPSDIGGGFTSVNHLGKSVYDADALLNGRVRSFAIYNRALSPQKVEARSIDGAKLMNCDIQEKDTLKIPVLVSYESKTVTFGVKPGTDLTKLTPTFDISSSSSVTPASGETVDLGKPVYYTLTDTASGQQSAVWTMQAVEMYSPVLCGDYADPNIFQFNGTYYIYATTDGVAGWGSNVFYVWKSTNLAHWTRSGQPILTLGGDNSNNVPWASGNAWAPTIIERNGRFFFYFSGNNPSVNQKTIGVAWADSPEGPFTADSLAMILNTETTTTGQAIDPAAFKDPKTGKYYIFWGNGSPLYAELSDSMTSTKSTSTKKIEGLTDFREGIFVVERNGRYHMTYSIDDTGSENYRVGYATADTINGPWQYRGIILEKNPDLHIYATGHDSIINIPNTDDWYIAYHRWVIPDGDGTHREVVIDKLSVDQDGYFMKVTPTLAGVKPIN